MLCPDFYFESVLDVPYERLYELGLRGLIFDIDNTLGAYEDEVAPGEICVMMDRLGDLGFKVGLLSNNGLRRMESFNRDMKLPGSARAAKPLAGKLLRLVRDMGLARHECAMVGDQLLTDIWCGRRAGVRTILVKPLTEREVLSVMLKRGLERRLFKRCLRGHVNPL